MRKRKYSQLDERSHHTDMLLEDVDAYYDMHEKPSVVASSLPCPALHIHNLVGTAMIRASSGVLDLRILGSMIPNCCYTKQKFAAITIRLHQPCCTALLFTSGKMVLTGCKSYLECIDCALQVVRLMRDNMRSTESTLYSVKVQNMVGNVVLNFARGFELRLDDMHRDHSIYCTYQKKMFPGLIYRPDNSPIVLLLFQSGKIVVTGGKSVHDMQQGWVRLWPFVLRYIRFSASATALENRWPAPALMLRDTSHAQLPV
jgi:transcription initiation factor TFIID TATA-box-binding protein